MSTARQSAGSVGLCSREAAGRAALMRYIGNKTRLLPFIRSAIRKLELAPGSAHDAFAGTASVGRALKADGWVVASSDLMTYSFVMQRAYVVAQRAPSFAALRAGDPDLRRALRSPALRARAAQRGGEVLHAVAEYLSRWVDPERGFVSRHFAPAGGRMFFTDENAGRIDIARRLLHEWLEAELISDDAYALLLAALLEGADRVANTAGVYTSYIKEWQPNALKPLNLAPVLPIGGATGSTANQLDAVATAAMLGPVDLLYIDPPYNSRQYSGYYHVPEVIARGWFDTVPVLHGKTGLLRDGSQRSDWCSPRKVGNALRSLLDSSGARHVLVSYNSEGLLPATTLKKILAERAVDGCVRLFTKGYKRYRADSDREGRRYSGDRVRERLYHVRRTAK
ncbi:MAG TPA: DNA adenine methylase [Gemmatimonadaceae bacterium]|nr:DNA adenine methylase [Gemmatimonadaceae bacterium]